MATPITDCLERGDPALPWLYGMAERLEGTDRRTTLADAGALSRTLSTAADLFELPAVCTAFDTALAAEAAGCDVEFADGTLRVTRGCIADVDDAIDLNVDGVTGRGHVPTTLEATERLVATLDDTSVLGGLAGPRELTRALLVDGDAGAAVDAELRFEATLTAGDIGVALANAFLDRNAHGIVVLEPDGLTDADRLRDAIVPLLNVIDHYEATGILVQRTVDADDVALAADLGFDAITGRVDGQTSIDAAATADVRLGVGVPADRLLEGPEAVEEFVDDHPAGTLLSTEWEVPPETEPEAIHRLMGSL